MKARAVAAAAPEPLPARTGPLAPVRDALDTARLFFAILGDSRDNLLAGAAARMVSLVCVQPLEAIKTKVQISDFGIPAKALRAQVLHNAPHFGGVLAAVIGQLPYGVFTFAAYEVAKAKLAEARPQWDERLRVIVAACAGDLVGSVWLAPWEGVKQRVQAGVAKSSLQSAAISARCGDLFVGYFSHLLRDLPFRAIQLALFEELRAAYKTRCARGRELSTAESFAVGATAGTITALVTTPMDVVRTRVMAQRPGPGSSYRGIFDVVATVVRREGPMGFMKGALPRMLAVAPTTAIFFFVYENTLRSIRSNQFAQSRAAALRPASNGIRKRLPAFQGPYLSTL